MTLHAARGAEALPTSKIVEQEIDLCVRNLSRHSAKVKGSKVAPQSSPSSVNFPQTLSSSVEEVDLLLNSEYLQPISYIQDAHKVLIFPPKGDDAYNMLQAEAFTDCQPTPLYRRRNDKYGITSKNGKPNAPRGICEPLLGYENHLAEMEQLSD